MVDISIGSNLSISNGGSFKPVASTAVQKDFMAELTDVYAKHTAKMVGTSVGGLGPIYTAKPENLQTLLNMKGSIV